MDKNLLLAALLAVVCIAINVALQRGASEVQVGSAESKEQMELLSEDIIVQSKDSLGSVRNLAVLPKLDLSSKPMGYPEMPMLPDLPGGDLPTLNLWGDKTDLATAHKINPNDWISCARRQLKLLVQTPDEQRFKVGKTIRIKREIRNVSGSPLIVPLSEKGVGEVGTLQAFIVRLGEDRIIPPNEKYSRGKRSGWGAGGTTIQSGILINPGECIGGARDSEISTDGYLSGEYRYSVKFSKGGQLIDYAEYKFVLE